MQDKKKNELYYQFDNGIHYFNMMPEMYGHTDESGEFIEGEGHSDFWVFDIAQYQYHIGVFGGYDLTDEEWESDWEDAVMETVIDIVNIHLPKGFVVSPNGWLMYLRVEQETTLSYEEARALFATAITRAEIIGNLHDSAAAVIRGIYQINKVFP